MEINVRNGLYKKSDTKIVDLSFLDEISRQKTSVPWGWQSELGSLRLASGGLGIAGMYERDAAAASTRLLEKPTASLNRSGANENAWVYSWGSELDCLIVPKPHDVLQGCKVDGRTSVS